MRTPERPHVLVVDDDPGIRAMLELALSTRGYHVDSVRDHTDGWHGQPDVVLLDVRLGSFTAVDFLEAASFPETTSVIVMTAGRDPVRARDELGAAAAIGKPFDLDDLFTAIEACLARPVASE